MTRKFKILAAALMLTGMVFQGCEKEATELVTLAKNDKMVMVYSIDGVQSTASLSDEEWDLWIHWMLALAREGKTVTFSNGKPSSTAATKEKVTYSTTSEEDAHNWAKTMALQGYTVSIYYSDGVYYCTAIK